MRSKLVIAALAALFLTATPTTALPAASPETWIVAVHAIPDGSSLHGERIAHALDGPGLLVVEVSNPLLFQARLLADANVRYAEHDAPALGALAYVPNDPGYSHPGHWGTKAIGAETAWDRTLGSTSVKVAVLDTGLNKGHEEFAGSPRVLQGWDFANNDNDPNDEGGACAYHGTHVTGIAGATIDNSRGIAGLSQHTILPVKAFRLFALSCTASTVALVNAITYAADQGAHVLSMSWVAGAPSTAISDALRYADARGALHVAAAGDSGPCANCVQEPWKSNGDIALVVSCIDRADLLCTFSSQGPQVDVAAPGVQILGPAGGTNAYTQLSGTSASAPFGTGTAALVKTLNPGFGPRQIEDRIKATAVDIGPPGCDDLYGCGRLNAAGAVY